MDNGFLNGINAKDAKAWKKLYRSFYGSLCNYALGMLKDKDVAEDVVQDSLLSMWNVSPNFSDIQSLTVYLYRSVHNNVLKYLRDKMTDELRMQKYLEEEDLWEDDENLYGAIEEELVRKLRMAIDLLPSQQRQILLLGIEGYTVQEVADRLHVSINTVKTQKKRAYAFLKTSLKDSYFLLIFLGFLK